MYSLLTSLLSKQYPSCVVCFVHRAYLLQPKRSKLPDNIPIPIHRSTQGKIHVDFGKIQVAKISVPRDDFDNATALEMADSLGQCMYYRTREHFETHPWI